MDLRKIVHNHNNDSQNTRNDGGDHHPQNRQGQASSDHQRFTGTQATHPEGQGL